jgi:hypothetical protein
MAQVQMLALRRADVPPAAIDFHCSNVIDSLLAQPPLRERLAAVLQGWQPSSKMDMMDAPTAVQRAMWACASSTNTKSAAVCSHTRKLHEHRAARVRREGVCGG